MIAVPTDWAIADPMAVTTIADTSIARDVENEAKIAPPANRTSPVRMNPFLPVMSATRPNGSMTELIVSDWAITTHETARRVMSKSLAMLERARKTMLKLITIVTVERPTAAKVFHL